MCIYYRIPHIIFSWMRNYWSLLCIIRKRKHEIKYLGILSKSKERQCHFMHVMSSNPEMIYCRYCHPIQQRQKKRSILREQTSTTPTLNSVKQSGQVWKSLADCFLCHVRQMCSPSVMLLTNRDPYRKILFPSCNIHKILQIVPCVISDQSWNFHENALIRISVMSPNFGTVKHPSHAWLSLSNCFVVSCVTYPESLTKIDSGSKELYATSLKCSRLFPVWGPNYSENFTKIPLSVLP